MNSNIIDQVQNMNIEQLKKSTIAYLQISEVVKQADQWIPEEKEESKSDDAQSIIDGLLLEDKELNSYSERK